MAPRNALIALFVAVIALPLAANLAGFDGANPVAENRRMAEFPRLDATWASLRAFPRGFTAWFEDHFGFRSTLVRASGDLRYFVLGVSPAASVVKGRDGWLFYADDSGMDDYARGSPFGKAALDEWRESVVRSQRWLHAQSRNRRGAFVTRRRGGRASVRLSNRGFILAT